VFTLKQLPPLNFTLSHILIQRLRNGEPVKFGEKEVFDFEGREEGLGTAHGNGNSSPQILSRKSFDG